jgi:hypothetical protein
MSMVTRGQHVIYESLLADPDQWPCCPSEGLRSLRNSHHTTLAGISIDGCGLLPRGRCRPLQERVEHDGEARESSCTYR